MTHLKDFTTSMERASQSNPMMQRWIHGTRELERQLSERLIHLCQYQDMIPEEVLASYAKVLLEALEDAKVEDRFSASSENLVGSVIKVARILEGTGDPQKKQMAKRICEIIGR